MFHQRQVIPYDYKKREQQLEPSSDLFLGTKK